MYVCVFFVSFCSFHPFCPFSGPASTSLSKLVPGLPPHPHWRPKPGRNWHVNSWKRPDVCRPWLCPAHVTACRSGAPPHAQERATVALCGGRLSGVLVKVRFWLRCVRWSAASKRWVWNQADETSLFLPHWKFPMKVKLFFRLLKQQWIRFTFYLFSLVICSQMRTFNRSPNSEGNRQQLITSLVLIQHGRSRQRFIPAAC